MAAMKTVSRVIIGLLFFVALTFAVKNTDMVTVRYYLGFTWQAPLIFVILVVFCLGTIAGVFASLAHIVRLRREISRLRKKTGVASDVIEPAATTRISDAV
jgi:lipopolysaccharide assembly protein A